MLKYAKVVKIICNKQKKSYIIQELGMLGMFKIKYFMKFVSSEESWNCNFSWCLYYTRNVFNKLYPKMFCHVGTVPIQVTTDFLLKLYFTQNFDLGPGLFQISLWQ